MSFEEPKQFGYIAKIPKMVFEIGRLEMFDAIVFDLDGTLWDASEASTLGWNNALRSINVNKTIAVAEMNQVTGKPFAECVKILCPEELNQHPNLLDTISHFEASAINATGGKLYPGLHETIATLFQKHDLFLVSNCQEWYLEVFFAFSGLKHYFKDVDCNGHSGQNKSAMLVNLKALHGFENPIYVGDTEGDAMAARGTGYSFVFARYGFGEVTNPELAIDSIRDAVWVLEE